MKSIFDAFTAAEKKGILPTSLSTEELRALPAELRARSFFTARGTSAVFAQAIKDVAMELASGDIGESEGRLRLLNVLNQLGYTPEAGFPDSPIGEVPPAERGSLQDLSSFRRLDLIIHTVLELVRGAGQQIRGHEPTLLSLFPCWELVRFISADEPRNWHGRFEFSGGTIVADNKGNLRMIAPKGDPVWGELGSSENFDDALDVDYAPFAFSSGMRLTEVSREESIALGVRASTGQGIDEFLASQPITLNGQLPLPTPRMSVKNLDLKVVDQIKTETKAEENDPGYLDYSDLLLEALQESDVAYGREARTTIVGNG